MDNAHKLKSNWKRMVEDAPNVNIANQTAPNYIPKNADQINRLSLELQKIDKQIQDAMQKINPLNIKREQLALKLAQLKGQK